MENKTLINKMKNAAELAQAAYGYYDLMTNSDNQFFIEIQNKKNEDFIKKDITLIDIMDSTYKNYEVYFFNPKTKKEEKVILLILWITHLQIIRYINHNYRQNLNLIK